MLTVALVNSMRRATSLVDAPAAQAITTLDA